MSRFEDVLASTRRDAVGAVLRLCEAYVDPDSQMSSESFLEAAVGLIGGAREQAKVIALALLAEYIEEETQEPYVFPSSLLVLSLAQVDDEGSTSVFSLAALYAALRTILKSLQKPSPQRSEGLSEAEGTQVPRGLSKALEGASPEASEPVPTVPVESKGVDTLNMKMERLVNNDVLFTAQKVTEIAVKEEPLIIGWTRDMEADACQLCRWWDREGRVWPVSHPMPTHKGCACSQKPVIATKG